jgi:hypothetical protein
MSKEKLEQLAKKYEEIKAAVEKAVKDNPPSQLPAENKPGFIEYLAKRLAYEPAIAEAKKEYARVKASLPGVEKLYDKNADEVRARALVMMVENATQNQKHHKQTHVKEVEWDVRNLSRDWPDQLKKACRDYFNKKFESLKDPVVREKEIDAEVKSIVKEAVTDGLIAAAHHDIVYTERPPKNEILSAEVHANNKIDLRNEVLDAYQTKTNTVYSGPALSAAQAQIENLRQATQDLDDLEAINSEITIVPSTWLSMNFKDGVHKDLDAYIDEYLQSEAGQLLMTDLQERQLSDAASPYAVVARLVSEALSKADTRRSTMEHVQEESLLLTALKETDYLKEPAKALLDFFNKAEIANPEAAMVRLVNNHAMLSEIPFGKDPNDIQMFASALQKLETSDSLDDSIDYRQMADIFFKYSDGEKNFARGMGKGGDTGWAEHESVLAKLKEFYGGLENTDKAKLGQTLMSLTAQFRPGISYLMTDPAYQRSLAERHDEQVQKLKECQHSIKTTESEMAEIDKKLAALKTVGEHSKGQGRASGQLSAANSTAFLLLTFDGSSSPHDREELKAKLGTKREKLDEQLKDFKTSFDEVQMKANKLEAGLKQLKVHDHRLSNESRDKLQKSSGAEASSPRIEPEVSRGMMARS